MTTTWAEAKLVAIMPFVAAVLVYLVSPQLSRLLRNTVIGRVEQANSRYSQKDGIPTQKDGIPTHLTPKYIGDYVEYAGDAAQVLPSTFLVLVGVVAALFAGIPVLIVGVLLIVSVPSILYVMLKVLNTDPSKYVRRGDRRVLKRYTYVTAVGIILNLFAIILVLIFLPDNSAPGHPGQPGNTISRSSSPGGGSSHGSAPQTLASSQQRCLDCMHAAARPRCRTFCASDRRAVLSRRVHLSAADT